MKTFLCVSGVQASPGQIKNAITELEKLSFLVSFKWSVYSISIGNRQYLIYLSPPEIKNQSQVELNATCQCKTE